MKNETEYIDETDKNLPRFIISRKRVLIQLLQIFPYSPKLPLPDRFCDLRHGNLVCCLVPFPSNDIVVGAATEEGDGVDENSLNGDLHGRG